LLKKERIWSSCSSWIVVSASEQYPNRDDVVESATALTGSVSAVESTKDDDLLKRTCSTETRAAATSLAPRKYPPEPAGQSQGRNQKVHEQSRQHLYERIWFDLPYPNQKREPINIDVFRPFTLCSRYLCFRQNSIFEGNRKEKGKKE
jgi:hypothetical protein